MEPAFRDALGRAHRKAEVAVTARQKALLGIATAWAIVAVLLLVLGDSRQRIYIVVFSGIAVAAGAVSSFKRT